MADQTQQAWQGKLFIGLLKFFSWWPLPVNHAMGKAIGYLLWWLPTSPKRISEINLSIAFPQLSEAERQTYLKQSLLELGKTTTELGPVWLWDENRVFELIQSVQGEHLVDEAFKQDKGVIILSPHLGAWEIMGIYLSRHYPMTTLYRPPNIRSIEAFMRQVRERSGSTLVPTDLSGVKALRKALQKNEMIGILPDQDPGKNGSTYAPFFGHAARTMMLVSKLASKSKSAVFFAYAKRLPKGQGYEIHFIPADEKVAATDELTATTALNQGVELCVKLLPTQYQWNYKRYKHPPEGHEDVYKKVKK